MGKTEREGGREGRRFEGVKEGREGKGRGRTEVETVWGQGRDKRKRREEEEGRRELKGR